MNWGHPDRGKVLLLAGDFILAAGAVILVTIPSAAPMGLARRGWLITVFALVYTTCFYVFDLYDVQALNGLRTVTRLLAAVTSGTFVLSFLLYLIQWSGFSRNSMAMCISILLITSFLWREFFKKHHNTLFTKINILLIGTQEDARNLHAFLGSEHSQFAFCGYLRNQMSSSVMRAEKYPKNSAPLAAAAAAGATYQTRGTVILEETALHVPSLTPSDNITDEFGINSFGVVNRVHLEETVLQHNVHTIVIRQDAVATDMEESLTRLRFQGVRISTMPDLCSQVLEELPIETLSDAWFSFATGFNLLHKQIFRRIKRLADIVMACVGLVVTFPVSVLVAIAIKLESRGPVLLRQWRVGWLEKPFVLLKFRSMREDAESDGKPRWASATDHRATRVGRIIRRLHIDEIPQMINVLLGEMSFVGPRPERPVFVEELKQQVRFYSLRHYLPPGITGWAQVNYPYGANVEDAKRKLQFDLFYVRNASPTLDLRILLRTARVILFRRGSR